MRKPRGYHNHSVAPANWRRTSNITGDYEMDASILHCKNGSVPSKLKQHLSSGNAYAQRTSYAGGSYEGYHGDD